MTNKYRHKHADLIHELVEDTRKRVREVGTQGPLLRFADVNFDGTGEIEIVRPDPHAEMRAKFEAEPDQYKIRCKFPWGEWSRWDGPDNSGHSRWDWDPDIKFEIEEIPHWELQAKVRKEPGKWDVEALLPRVGWYLVSNPEWNSTLKYRLVLKRKMLTIIGVDGKAYEFPEPLREAPSRNMQYWCVAGNNSVDIFYWHNDSVDNKAFRSGNVHRTREDAITCRNAWVLARGGKLPEGEEE